MNLVLHAVSLNGQPLSQAITGYFDDKGGTIGRSDSATMSLPDPQRHISRLQAEVFVRGERFGVRDAGAANPVMLNDRVLARGEEGLLAESDELRIGDYVLKVRLNANDVSVRTITQGRANIDTKSSNSQTLDERRSLSIGQAPRAAESAANPFADLFGEVTSPAPMPEGPALAASMRTDDHAPAPATLPDDFDPFADLLPRPAPPPPASPAAFHGAQAAASLGIIDDGFEEAFGLAPTTPGRGDPLGDFLAPSPQRKAAEPSNPMFDDLLGLGPGGAPVPAVASNHVSALAEAYVPPKIVDPAAPRRAPAIARTEDPALAPLLQAFFDGARLDAQTITALDTAQMHRLGCMVRETVDGVVRLMAIRATAKKELRAAVTTIQATGNNPLKFCPDPESAFGQLMRPPVRGFVPPDTAMREAMHDLAGHAVGSIAGMQAALVGLLGEFEPGVLEQKLSSRHLLDVLSMNRKARLWDLYVQHFAEIRADAENGFHELFGRAFISAYEGELDRLPQPAGR